MRSVSAGSNFRAWIPQQIKTDQLVLNDHFTDTASGWIGSNLSWMAKATVIPEEWQQWVAAVPPGELDVSAGTIHASQQALLEALSTEDKDNWDRSHPVEPVKLDDSTPDWETLNIRDDTSIAGKDGDLDEDDLMATYAIPLYQLAAVEKMVMDEEAGWEWRWLYYPGPEQDSLDECDLLVLFDPSRTPQGAVMVI